MVSSTATVQPGSAWGAAAIARRARACRRCPKVAPGSAVLSRRNGPAPADVLFVAEAPGYLGGVRYGVPLWGDRTGKNFRAYCAEAGVDLERAFISNAVLCHPPSGDGRNRRPSATELRNCNDFLRSLIGVVDPGLVVALGRVALDAVAQVMPHGSFSAVIRRRRWRGLAGS